ncbi:hypothetical protein C8Q72DRAFT_865617 [Fomitopsis betulina]|nr:hypothetical protein C8Q72DRAFT_865617 [Fomitopsis betulina]
MTEYTSNSEAVREHLSALERTAMWVDAHSPTSTVSAFVSPSYPPSIVAGSDAPSYGPDSDEESSHSLPPRMVLRYNDGRPDIPITTEYNPHNGTYFRAAPKMHSAEPRTTNAAYGRSRSRSHAPLVGHVPSQVPPRHEQSLSYASQPVMEPLAMPAPPRSPESIVVLPSRQGSQNTQSTSQASQNLHQPQSHHQRTPSFDAALQVPLPPSTLSQIPQQSSRFGGASRHTSHPSQHGIASPSPRRAFDPSQIPPASSPPLSQPIAGPIPRAATSSAPHPPSSRVQSQLPYTYSPPAIVYAPSSKHSRSNYAPPAIVYSPSATQHAPSRHAPSMTYSRSDPLPHTVRHQRTGSGPSVYQLGQGSMRSRRPGPAIPEEQDPRMGGRYDRSVERDRGRSRSRGRSVARTRTPAESVMYLQEHELPPPPRGQTPSDAFEDEDERGTQASGSTYYVLPTPGQKVKLIVPNAHSIYTATSTTKSGHSPQSAHPGPKKAFFQRIFSIPKLSGSSSSSDGSGKRVHRRHTIGTHMQGRMGLPPR